jgi:hypothetical protein
MCVGFAAGSKAKDSCANRDGRRIVVEHIS